MFSDLNSGGGVCTSLVLSPNFIVGIPTDVSSGSGFIFPGSDGGDIPLRWAPANAPFAMRVRPSILMAA